MKKIFFLASAVFFASWAVAEMVSADLKSEPNKIGLANLKSDPDSSVFSIIFAKPGIKYRLEPRLGESTYRVTFKEAAVNPVFEYKTFEDALVKTVNFHAREDGTVTVDIALKDVKTSIFRTLSKDGLTLSLRFIGKPELMAVKTENLTPEEMKIAEENTAKQIVESARLQTESGANDFKSAIADYMIGKFKPASEKFGAFIEKHPKSPFLEKAYYLRAESFYMTGRDKKSVGQAINAYKDAINLYPASESVSRGQLRLADMYLLAGMDVEAMSTYDALVRKMGGNKYIAQGLMGRSKIFMMNKLYYEASNELEKILLFFPKSPEVRDAKLNMGEALSLRGKYEDALRVYDSLNKRWPDYLKGDKAALYHYGRANLKAKRLEPALGLFSDLANIFPDSNEGRNALNDMADIYFAKGKTLEAVKLFGIQASSDPEGAAGLRARLKLASLGQLPGRVLSKTDEFLNNYSPYFNPMATYEDIITKHPNEAPVLEAMYQKAMMLYRQREYTHSLGVINDLATKYDAVTGSKQLLDLSMANLYAMVRSYHQQGGEYEAVSVFYNNFVPYFQKIKDEETLLDLADALRIFGLYSKALDKYAELAKLPVSAKNAARAAYGWGASYAALNMYDDSLASLKKFTKPFIKSEYASPALYVLGTVYERMDDDQRAIAVYKLVLSLDKKGDYALASAYRAGLIDKEFGKNDEAVQFFNAAIANFNPKTSEYEYLAKDSYYQAADCAFKAGRYEKAFKYAQIALDNNPSSPKANWAKFMMSDAQARLDRDEKATASFKVLAKEQSASPYKNAAVAIVGNAEWKEKNQRLFPY
ncbi:MAG: tetratricopeptide repeat protein [Nitrospinae bacterium]|nr:tetratricopeptide repeat protein [Nitrospinota bacterium]